MHKHQDRPASSRQWLRRHDLLNFIATLYEGDLHAKRVLSLANATQGVLTSASLAIHAVGRGLAQAMGTLTKHGVKQVDRLLSNRGVDVWAFFAYWTPFIVAARTEVVVALDWTSFAADGQDTIVLSMVTGHGRATPLLWKTVASSTLKGNQRRYEYELLCRLREVLPAGVKVTLVADRGFGDCKLFYALTTELAFEWVRLFFVEEFSPYSWAFLPADASLQCSFRGDSNQASAYPRLSGGQPSLETVPNTVGLSPSGALPSGHSRGVLVRCRGKGGRPAMAVTTGFQGRTFDVPRTGVPCIDLPSRAPCAAADAVFADAKAFLSSSEARQMSESELERELHRRRQDLVRKLLQGHRDQRSPKEAAGPAEDTSGVECSEPREHESHAETTSGTMQVVGLGCARRGHDGLHRLDAALNLLPERYLVEMRRRVTIATASRAPPRTPWKPQWYSTSSTWQRRRGVRCSSSAHRRACRHLVRDPMGVDRRTVTLGCSCGGSQLPQAAGALMRTETSHEAREDQRKSPIGR